MKTLESMTPQEMADKYFAQIRENKTIRNRLRDLGYNLEARYKGSRDASWTRVGNASNAYDYRFTKTTTTTEILP